MAFEGPLQVVIVAIDMEKLSTQKVADTMEQIKAMDGVLLVQTLEWLDSKVREKVK
jgi:hypothetical protein